jgi:hypothetical protein
VGRALAGLAAAAALLAGCGESGAAKAPARPAAGSLALAVRYDDGAGRVRSGRLTCAAGEQRAAGALAGGASAARLCRRARAIAPLLTKPPPKRVACTQIYGGPQTLRVTGTIDGRAVKRRFARTNGCEIADFDRVAGALPVTK